MGWYLQIDGKMGCRADTDVGHGCALGPDREVAEHTASQYVEGLAGREVRVVEMDYCPAEAADHAIYMEHMEANDPQARERALSERLDQALAVLAKVEWQDVGGDERRCPSCGTGEHQGGHGRGSSCALAKALQGESGRH